MTVLELAELLDVNLVYFLSPTLEVGIRANGQHVHSSIIVTDGHIKVESEDSDEWTAEEKESFVKALTVAKVLVSKQAQVSDKEVAFAMIQARALLEENLD